MIIEIEMFCLHNPKMVLWKIPPIEENVAHWTAQSLDSRVPSLAVWAIQGCYDQWLVATETKFLHVFSVELLPELKLSYWQMGPAKWQPSLYIMKVSSLFSIKMDKGKNRLQS